jgi:hypothetical protein
MRHAGMAAAIFVAGSLGASAQNVTLAHKTPAGEVLAVEESSLLDLTAEIQHPDRFGGKTKSHWKRLEHKVRTFTQQIVEAKDAGTRTLDLDFSSATQETMQPNGKDRFKLFTSLHGKRLRVDLANDALVKIKAAPAMPGDVPPPPAGRGALLAGHVTPADQNDLLLAERLYSTLPKGEVKPGQVWPLDPAVAGRAIFGAQFNPALHKVEGRCQYHGPVTIEGRPFARILMQVKAGGQFGGLLSTLQIETAPEGVLLFSLDDGFIQSYELAGPVKVSALIASVAHAEGGGQATFRYKAKLEKQGSVETNR